MPREKRFVAPHPVFPRTGFTRVEQSQPVDETKLRSVRQRSEGGGENVGHTQPSEPPPGNWQAGKIPIARDEAFGQGRVVFPNVPSAEPSAIPSLPAEISTWRGGLRAAWDYFAMATGLLYWAVFGLLFTLLGGPLHLLLPKRTGEAFGRGLLHRAFGAFVRLLKVLRLVDADLRSLDRLKAVEHPFILAPNHLSLWDAVFLIARLPRAVCVMKESILLNPFLGGGARLAGYIPNGATGRMIREAADALHAGGRLLLFPEATRTRPDIRWVNPLKGGCALIALRANVPVIPVFIRSNSRFAEKGWPLWRRPRFPIAMDFELGEPLYPEPYETSQAFTARLQAVYERELSKPHPLRREAGV